MLLSITNFKGIVPRSSPDLIGFVQAQTAENCKLNDGQLQPWDNYLFTQLCNYKGIVKTVYLYEDEYWLEWEADVDIVPAPVSGDTESKLYYTGDGLPKKTNLDEAVTGSGAMPINFFPLFVPTPKTALTAADGAPPAGSGDDRAVNYVWTVVTDWGEEGFPSPVSADFTGKNGQSVDLSAMSMIWVTGTAYAVNDVVFPTATEGGDYMYVCVQAGTSGAGEPTWGTTVDGNTIDNTVVWRCYKNNIVGKRIYRLAVGDQYATYNYLTQIAVAATTYTDETEDADLSDPCPTLSQASGGAADADYDPPPQNLQGITYIGNGIMLGFVGKDLYACVPYKPWAWPIAYILSLSDDIVCISSAGAGNTAVATTTKNPYLISGSDPSALTATKLPEIKPNLSKRGTKCYGTGVIYPAPDGLRAIGSDGSTDLLTKNFYDVETWKSLHPETMHACIHDNKYFGFYQSGDDEGGIVVDLLTGIITTLDFYSFATYIDPETDTLYYLRSPAMTVHEEILTNPDAPTTTGKATQFSLAAAGALAGIVQPDYPRNLVYTITGTITSIQITVTGTLATGETEQTEVITAIASSVGNKAFAHIDSITVDAVVGGAGDTLDIGHGVKFGLGNAIEASDDVFKTNMDDDNVAVAGHTISTTYSTITFATAPNAAHDYQVWYTAE